MTIPSHREPHISQSSKSDNAPKTAYETAMLVAQTADSKKAANIRVLLVEPVTTIADYFVICSADSMAQIRAIADTIQWEMKKHGIDVLGKEPNSASRWMLLDIGDVVVHLFHKDERDYYELETFWSHASEIQPAEWESETPPERQVS